MVRVRRDLEHSRRRARLRERVLIELARFRIATVGEISRATRIRPSRVVGIMKGDGDEYAYDLSLVNQGAAREYESWAAEAFAITPQGAREVARLLNGKSPGGPTWDHVAEPGNAPA